MLEKLIPKNSKRRKILKKVLGRSTIDPYARWKLEQKDKIELHEASELRHEPLISVVVPAYNTPDKYLYPFVRSVVHQTYENWELIIVDASTDKTVSQKIKDCELIDTRLKVIKTKNNGISANTNVGIRVAEGKFIGFMDHDDTLEHSALKEIVKVINTYPDVGLIYTDEDKLSEDGSKYLDPHFKPDWSPHLLAGLNYITHFVVARKDLVARAGYLDSDKDGAQDYDFLLRITDLNTPVKHIPKILYHWRIAQGSTAASISNKSYVLRAGEKALQDHYERHNINAVAHAIPGLPGWYKGVYKNTHKTTVIIQPFANRTLVKKYMDVLAKKNSLTGYKVIAPYEHDGFEELTVIDDEAPFSFLKMAISKAGSNVVILNDFVLPEGVAWADELVGLLQYQTVHSITPVILQTDKSILDLGIVRSDKGKEMLFYGLAFGEATPFGNTMWPRNVDELSGAVLAARTKELKDYLDNTTATKFSLNGYSQTKPVAHHNVAWSHVVLTHAKVPLVPKVAATSYFNPNIHLFEDHIRLYANEQQLLDALIAMEQG